MIIVVLLFFQSLCLYLQNIVLTVHDKWLNPKHARLLIDQEQQRLQLFALKPKHPVPGCSFCSNSPLGYCRHHNPNQPTLRHLKNRLIAKGSRTAALSGGEAEKRRSIGGAVSSLSTSVEGGTFGSSSYLGGSKIRQNPAKLCACLSCSHGDHRNAASNPSFRKNRTSWGTRSGNAYCGERLLTSNVSHQGRFGEDSETGIVVTTRRGRRYEKLSK